MVAELAFAALMRILDNLSHIFHKTSQFFCDIKLSKLCASSNPVNQDLKACF